MNGNELLEKYLNIAVKEGLCSSKGNLIFYLNYLFQDIPSFIGKTMIDIGCGCGMYSFYAACRGVKHITCLDPELVGSTKGMLDKFRKLSSTLSLSNINFQTIRFQDFDAGSQIFDIILLHNSINHLDEEACIRLQYDNNAKNRYKLIFQKLSKLAAPKAKLIVVDCSRNNFFAFFRFKNPFAPAIEWHKHQSPEFWANILSDYGFVNPRIRWTSFNDLRKIGIWLFGNRFASYFLTSHFLLVMEKKYVQKNASEVNIHV
jgi:SAM-dependent methyltransferase